MSNLCQQPIEVLEHVIDELDGYEDLLSLAMSCARFRDLLIPAHLSYRRVVVSIYFQPFFDLILSRPDLAGRVRELTLVNTTSNLVVPRGHAFRRSFHVSRLISELEDEEGNSNSTADAGPGLPLDLPMSMLIENALKRLRRLRRLGFRGRIEGVPFDRIIAFHQDRLEGIAMDGKEGSDSLERYWGSPPSNVWNLSGLCSFELDIRLGCAYWNRFCVLLTRSPMLEILVVPSFDPCPPSSTTFSKMPRLMRLQRVSVREGNLGSEDEDVLSERIYTFLNDHPTIAEVVWRMKNGYPMRMPRLPAVKRMINIGHADVQELLDRHRRKDYVLFGLDTVTLADMKLDDRWAWSDLSLIFPSSLRVLHIEELHVTVESNEMLDALARCFPNLEELHLPEYGSHYVTRSIQEPHTYPPTKTSVRLHVVSEIRRPQVRELIKRFPLLTSVSGVGEVALEAPSRFMVDYRDSDSIPMDIDVKRFLEASRVLIALRGQFPLLRVLNGWRLDTNLEKELVLESPRTYTLIPAKAEVILTRNSIRVRYPGTRVDSQPVPLRLKRPNPISRRLA